MCHSTSVCEAGSCDQCKLGIYPMALPEWQNPGKHSITFKDWSTLVCTSYACLRSIATVTYQMAACTRYGCLQPCGEEFRIFCALLQRRLHNWGFLVHRLSRGTGAPLFIALRASTGFGIGTACFVLTVCSSEVSTPHVRPSLSSRLRV